MDTKDSIELDYLVNIKLILSEMVHDNYLKKLNHGYVGFKYDQFSTACLKAGFNFFKDNTQWFGKITTLCARV